MPTARSIGPRGQRPRSAERGFHPLRWIHRLLSRPLKIKRIGRQWHVVFDVSRMVGPATSSKPGSRGEALRLAHLALQVLLARVTEQARLKKLDRATLCAVRELAKAVHPHRGW